MGCSEPAPNVPIPATGELRALQGTSWLVRRVTFEEPDRSMPQPSAAGYDVDQHDSDERVGSDGTCQELNLDFVSSLDPGMTGIDNAGAAMISTAEALVWSSTFQEALDDAMREGRVRWALRVGHLDEDETSIALDIFVIDASEPLQVGPDGMPLAGQLLRARRIAQTRGPVRRHVGWGRVETEELTIPGDVYLLPFDQLHLSAFGIAAGPSPDELRGNLGGSFAVDAVVAVTQTLVDSDESLIRSVLDLYADLGPSAADPYRCERMSVGLAFEAVPVELVID